MQSGSPQSWNVNKDKANVQFVKNKNKSGGARQAGSGQERLRQIPVPGQGKQARGSKGSAKLHVPHELSKVRQGPSTLDDNTTHKQAKYRKCGAGGY